MSINDWQLLIQWKDWFAEKKGLPPRKYTQKQFAEDCGLTPQYLTHIKNDRNIGKQTAEKIAKSLNISLSQFFGSPPKLTAQEILSPSEISDKTDRGRLIEHTGGTPDNVLRGEILDILFKMSSEELKAAHNIIAEIRDCYKTAKDKE